MAYFKQGGNNRGGSRFGGDSRRPSFGSKKSWGDDRGGKPTMHKAVCANCGKECEVPFRPMPGKSVYCRDCFGKQDTRSEGHGDRPDQGERFFRKDFRDAPQTRTSFSADRGTEDLKRELTALNVKMDRLVAAVERMAYPKPASLAEAVSDATSKPQQEKAEKKVAKAKKEGKKK